MVIVMVLLGAAIHVGSRYRLHSFFFLIFLIFDVPTTGS